MGTSTGTWLEPQRHWLLKERGLEQLSTRTLSCLDSQLEGSKLSTRLEPPTNVYFHSHAHNTAASSHTACVLSHPTARQGVWGPSQPPPHPSAAHWLRAAPVIRPSVSGYCWVQGLLHMPQGPESRQMPRDKGAPTMTGGTRRSRRTHYMASPWCRAPCSEVVPSQSFSPLLTLTTQRRGHGRHHPRWTEGKQSPAQSHNLLRSLSGQWGIQTTTSPISTGSSFPADTQSSGLCDQINTGCYLHGRHETLLKTGFTGNRTRDGAGEHSRQLPSWSGNQATSPRSRLQQGVSAMGLGLVLCTDPSGLEENAPFP